MLVNALLGHPLCATLNEDGTGQQKSSPVSRAASVRKKRTDFAVRGQQPVGLTELVCLQVW